MNRENDLLEVPEGWGFVQTMDRREFLKLTSYGLLVMCAIDPLLGMAGPIPAEAAQRAAPDINAFLHIGADGRVTCLVGKIEMGQGIMTALPQLAAEELSVPLSSVDIVMGDTDICPTDGGTYGSLSVRVFGPTLRAAAAEAREVLVQMAAERLQLPVADLDVRDGVVVSKTDRTKHVSYGELTAGKRIERRLEGQAVLKKVGAFTIMGKSAPRRDALEKVTGKAKFAGDIAPSGALHARILRPPSHGATFVRADTSAAEAVPGVRVVRDGDLIAVLHAHRDEATRTLALVKATWSPSPSTLNHENIFEHLQKVAPEGRETGSRGSLVDGEKSASQVVEQTYLKGYVAHAAMETHSAVAAVENGKVTVWAGTQTPFPLKTQIARALNLAPEKVRVITPYVGGGFGGKSASMQGVEAARLAMATGKPVRVVWGREEEFFFDTFDPAAVFKIRAGLDAAKNIVFWDNVVIGAGERGSALFYDVPNHRTMVRGGWNGNTGGMHPFGVGPWRAPGANANVFARESHIDVMAAKAGLDPVEFRMRNLTDARMRRVLEAAAKRFGWSPKPAPSGRGFGVACGNDAGTYVATMAEVKVDKGTGKVRVVRVVCAQDMGIVVNPEGAAQQMEGCITMGLGYTLAEEVHFKDGVVLDTNFGTYELPRFSAVPRIDTVILDSPDLAPQGGGEPAIITTGAVVANAVFDAVGARVVQLPMTPARVKGAMKG
jgi:nicotinate dehydrogenase subunit B